MMIDLSLTQQYAILAVNDKGKFSSMDQNAMVCLVVAGVLELEQAGCIAITDKKATTAVKLPDDCDYLSPLYDYIHDSAPVKIDNVVDAFVMSFTGKRFDALEEGVMAALKAQHLTERVESGLFSNKISFAPSEKATRMVVDNLRAELLADDPVDETTAALAVLLDKSGKIKEHFAKDERRAMKERLKALAATPEGALVAKAVERIETLFTLMVVTVIS